MALASLQPTRTRLRRPTPREWLLFALQVVLVSMVEVGNDIVRGNIWPPNATEALRNTHQVVAFETAHGFFIEPALQEFFEHAHHILGFLLTWHLVVDFTDNIYAICHIGVSLAVAVWVFMRHRRHFALLRNITLLTNVLALVGYELYPMAPPRLTTGLIYDGHHFVFQDTMGHILGDGKLNGTPIGYNPLSAMPSLHVAWAIIMGVTIVLLARNPILRAIGAIYPIVMTLVVLVTANHYVMDVVGAALAVLAATVLSSGGQAAVAWLKRRRSSVDLQPGELIVETRLRPQASGTLAPLHAPEILGPEDKGMSA